MRLRINWVYKPKKMLPMQPGDVQKTWAKVDDLFEYIDFKPQVGIREGIRNFVEWYANYYMLKDSKKEVLDKVR